MATPPAYLLHDFDPRAVKVAELRGILLAHDVPYASNAKKADLIAAYEKSIRPRAPRLIAEMKAVRASDHGVLDGESQGSSLRELDTDYEGEVDVDEQAAEQARPRKKTKSRKAAASTKTGKAQKKGSAMGKTKAEAQAAAESSGVEEDSAVEEPRPAPKKGRWRSRKTPSVEPMDIDEPVEPAYEEPVEYTIPLRDEYDTEEDEAPRVSPEKRKVGHATPRLSELTAGSRKGRLSLGAAGSDGNFSDYNPFQSGGEETPRRDTKRRKSSLGPSRHAASGDDDGPSRLKARKSMPALPSQSAARKSTSISPPKRTSPSKTEWHQEVVEDFSPEVEQMDEAPVEQEPAPLPSPPKAPVSSPRKSTAARTSLGSGTPIGVPYMVPSSKVKTTPPQFAELLRQREAEQASPAGRVVGPSPRGRRSSSPIETRGPMRAGSGSASPEAFKEGRILPRPAQRRRFDWGAAIRMLRGMLIGASILYALWWREEKLAVGFCDTGSTTNPLVASRDTSLAAPLPPVPRSLLQVADRLHLRPTCTPCPQHGHCMGGKFVGCTLDYVPRQSPLRLGGLLPIAPRCVPDTEKLMLVAMQASKASRLLRQRRGEVICKGLEKARRKESDQEARIYGLQAEAILAALQSENERSGRPFDEDALEEVNRLALRDLESHGEVVVWQNGDDYWFASQSAEMPVSCRMRLAAIRSLKRHKARLSAVFALLGAVLWARRKLRSRRTDAELVRQLVQVALRQLQQQERSHHVDPVHVPFPHVVPSHLRDLILQEEHSPKRRAALWRQVERIVEGNANVRVADVEQYGEEMRGWLWTGPKSRLEPAQDGQEVEMKPQMVEGARVYPSLVQSPARG